MKHEHLGVNPLGSVTTIAEQVKSPIVTTGLRVAFTRLIDRISENPPHTILGNANDRDLEDRSDHLHDLLKDVEAYVLAVLKDTQSYSKVFIDCSSSVTGCISDLEGDVCGALLNAAADMRGEPW